MTSEFKNSIEDKAAWVKRKCAQSSRNEKERGSVNDRGNRRFLNQASLLLLCHDTCPCCSNPLDYSSRQQQLSRNIEKGSAYWRENVPAIDRIDSSRPYEDGNVAVTCLRCNMIKGDYTWDQIMKVASYLKTLEGMKKNND